MRTGSTRYTASTGRIRIGGLATTSCTVVEYEGGVLIPAEEYDCPICELCGKLADDNVILRDRETGDPITSFHRCR